jgi:MoxR-like ATPase
MVIYIYIYIYIYVYIYVYRLKVVQLEELLQIRHCVFVMGPPGAGKTQAWKTLAEARYVLQSCLFDWVYVLTYAYK